ncbi:MAG: peptidoglycan DD-metalloendopeptidase family protein [Lachnospiraceae bacterium]|nr:peptidoglycan DD-metalloendopeptidase family protein [Lachnospiraceae bacterium]MBQ9614145.1 peptidoglycan DD-metalloendopeptidase family protein [Lachnospiraceae bacterium]
MSAIFLKILNMSITASWLILAVIAARQLLRTAPKWTVCLLWGMVALRLICPFSMESTFSLIPSTETIPSGIADQNRPSVNTGITLVNDMVNPAISASFTPNPGDSVSPLQIIIPIAAAVWITGMILMLAYALISYLKLKRSVMACMPVGEDVFACDEINTPFILGVFRPLIYVPSFMDGDTLSFVLRHERAHLQRHDHWWKPFGYLLLAVHWFNPLCWIAYILLCKDIEMACDEKVIRDMDKDAMAAYSQAILDCSFSRKRIAACPLAFGEVGVKERVKGVLNYRRPTFWIILIAGIVCIALALCLMTDPLSKELGKTPAEGESSGRFYLTIGAKGVKSIDVVTPHSSGGCQNADGSLFKEGETFWLEPLDGVQDLCGVTITALDENGAVIWTASIPDNEENKGFTHLIQDGWEVTSFADLETDMLPSGTQDEMFVSFAGEDYTEIRWQGRTYVPYCPVDNRDRGAKLGHVGEDENDEIYEYRDYSAAEWLISFYHSGLMDSSMLMREVNVTKIPEGLSSEYWWNEPGLLVPYEQTQDGQWEARGKQYRYCLTLRGRGNNAARESEFTVLSNEQNITFEEVLESLFSSQRYTVFDYKDAILVRIGTLEEDETNAPGVSETPKEEDNGQNASAVTQEWRWPLEKTHEVGDYYGIRVHPLTGEERMHDHVNLRAEEEEWVVAAIGGKIKDIQYDPQMGNTVIVDAGDGIETEYGHLSKVGVSEIGGTIHAGDVIGMAGKTGTATGTNLSFKVIVNGSPVDPMQFIGD